MADIASTRASVRSAFRDYRVDGVPASGDNEPSKAEIREALADDLVNLIEDVADSALQGVKGYATLAELPSLTSEDVGALAKVEETDLNYRWDGTSWVEFDDPTVGASRAYTNRRVDAERTLSDQRFAKSGVIQLTSLTGVDDLSAEIPAEFSDVPLVNGTRFAFQVLATNTGPMTLMGLPLVDQVGSPMRAGTLRALQSYEVRYSLFDGGRYVLVSSAIARFEMNERASRSGAILLTSVSGGNDIAASIPVWFQDVDVLPETQFLFRAPATTTGPVTLMGRPLVDQNGEALAPGTIVNAKRYIVVYTAFAGGRYVLVSSGVDRREIIEMRQRDTATWRALSEVALMTGVYSPVIPLLEKVGAWYDFTDRSTLWQDPSRTAAVRSDGDPIGYVEDKSGQGRHFVALAADGSRPQFRTAVETVKSAARFAAGQCLTGVRHDLTRGADKITIMALVAYEVGPTGNRCVIGHSTGMSATSSRVFLGVNGIRGSLLVRQADGAASLAANGFIAPGRNYDVGAWMVLEASVDFAEGKSILYSNGDNSPEGYRQLPSKTNAADVDELASWMGGFGVSLNSFVGDVAQVVEIRGEISEDERAGLYAYFAKVAAGLEVGDLEEYDPAGPLPVNFFWFNQPNVLRLTGPAERYAVGGVASGGSTMVGDYRFDSEDATISHAMLFSQFETDDHVVPAFAELADGAVMAVYTKHGFPDGSFYMQKTAAPGDLSSWSAPVNIGPQIMVQAGHTVATSYNYLFRLTGESNRLYLIYREGDRTIATDPDGFTGEYWVMAWSDNNGATWSRAKRLWGPMRPYTRCVSNGVDRIDFFFNDSHPVLDAANDVHHCYYRAGALYKSDGTLIATMSGLPALGIDRFSDPTLVYDVATDGEGNSWIWDLTYDPATAHPIGTYVAFVGSFTQGSPYVTINSLDRIDYYQARWNGAAWTRHKVCDAGAEGLIATQPYYTGGVITDPQDPDVVYCSRPVDGIWQIVKYVTTDNGAAWVGTQLTFGDKSSFRPVIAAGSRKLFYVTGDYGPNYSSFHTKVAFLSIDG